MPVALIPVFRAPKSTAKPSMANGIEQAIPLPILPSIQAAMRKVMLSAASHIMTPPNVATSRPPTHIQVLAVFAKEGDSDDKQDLNRR